MGQLLIVHFHGDVANEDAATLIENDHVGGFIYYNWANGLNSPQQVQRLTNGLQTIAQKQRNPIPLFITVDQEGGRVNRLNQGFTLFPGNRALAKTGNPQLVYDVAYATGQELHAVGVNMNLAPVVDVDTAVTPVIGNRSFGSSPQEVTRLGGLAASGFLAAHVIPVLKHFPGYGSVSVDPHAALPMVNKTRAELDSTELYPFRMLSNNADAIMTAHIMLPNIDKVRCATLSPAIVQGILRDEFGFKGLIISDSLIMRGVTDCCGDVAEASVQAFLAGHDILLLGGKLLNEPGQDELLLSDIHRVHQALIAAVRSGRISEERLNTSVKRILDLKQKYGLFKFEYPGEKEILRDVNTAEHRALSQAPTAP